jgi:hypothetical protein
LAGFERTANRKPEMKHLETLLPASTTKWNLLIFLLNSVLAVKVLVSMTFEVLLSMVVAVWFCWLGAVVLLVAVLVSMISMFVSIWYQCCFKLVSIWFQCWF